MLPAALLDVRAMRLVRGQKLAGSWPSCSRSLAIWWFPRNPRDVQQIHLDGVQFDAHKLTGDDWKSARIMQFILGDELLLVADAGQDHEGELDNCVIDSPEDAVTTPGAVRRPLCRPFRRRPTATSPATSNS